MKIETADSKTENRILLAMVTDPVVLAKLAPKWEGRIGPLASQYANLVGGWCVTHFKRHSTSPGRDIESRFRRWADKKGDDDPEVKLVHNHLLWLSEHGLEEMPEVSSEQVLDDAFEHINAVKVRKLNESTGADLQAGEVSRALERIATFSKEELLDDGCEDIVWDEGEVRETFSDLALPLIEFEPKPEHDGLRHFFQSELSSESFVAFQAPEKTGKSFILMEMAVQAMLNRKRVAFFEVGDQTRRQFKRRFYSRICEHPWKSPNGRWPYSLPLPTSVKMPPKGEDTASVTSSLYRDFDRPLDAELTLKGREQFMLHRVCSKKCYLKLSVHPNSSLDVAGIRAKLLMWKLAGWTPEVIIIDYADILALPSGFRADKTRDAINEQWKQLRCLSQEQHCLLLTATQADSESYRVETQDRRNFSEDKRKLSHVTGLVGINVTAKEKEAGVMRLNWIAGREIPWSSKKCCYLATCLPLCNPAVLSAF